MSKKRNLTLSNDSEVLMIVEHMQQIAGDNRIIATVPLKVVIEGRNTGNVVEITAMSEKAVINVVQQMSDRLYEKFNRLVTWQRDKLYVSAPQV